MDKLMMAIFVAGLVGSACTSKKAGSVDKEEATPVSEAPASKPAAAKLDLLPGWRALSTEAVEGERAEKLEAARKAKMDLGSTLVRTLKEAIGEKDFVRGVKACKEAAPTLSEAVSKTHDVAVGRTSFKVRNPDNRPRDWAKPIVDARWEKEVLLEGPEGTIAYMAPIRLAEVCVTCHGGKDEIPGEVKRVLAESYPEDEATGFAPGDLRGWFWVELSSDADS